MAGGLLDAARADARAYVKEGGFEEDITLTNPSNSITVNITGLATKHHMNFDTDGTVINAKNAHITVNETELSELNYPVRDANQEINLINHRVSVKDSSGVVKEYIIKENNPSETLGLIACILGDYE